MPIDFTSLAFDEKSLWGQCLTDFLSNAFNHSGSHATHRMYTSILQRFLSSPAKPVDAYTRQDVEAFIRRPSLHRNKNMPPSVATRNQRLACIASLYSYAATYTVPGKDGKPEPLLKTVPPTLGMKQGKPARAYHFLSYDEFSRFMSVIPDTVQGSRDKALYLLFFWTARRRSEIAHIRYGDIERGTIVEPDGARREGWLYHFSGKGHSRSMDSAELPEPAKRAIDRYLEKSGRIHTIKPEDALFVSMITGKPLGHNGIYNNLKRYARMAGIDERRVGLHMFRHMAARERYQAGSDIRSIQHLLRHQNLTTTDLYLRVLVSQSDTGAKLLYDKFGKFS